MWSKALAILIAFPLLGAPVISQSNSDDAQHVLNAGVARISLIKGDVTYQRADTQDWEAATVNLPMAEGDKVTVGNDSHAEIQLYGDNYIRLASNSELQAVKLTEPDARFRLLMGTATVHANRIEDDIRLRIDTPSTNISFNKRGNYRINLLDGGDTEFQVRKGQAEISWSSGVLDLKSGRSILIHAQDPSNYEISQDIRTDGWDRWNEDRDRYLSERQTASRYVSPSIWGARDIDYYGSWNYIPSQGYCWFPSVGYGWAPYRLGRWAWLYPYGWTWVSYEPWGWAPYHYGYWSFFSGFGWGWYPGIFHQRHFFRPALVTFITFGSGGSRYIGWIPWSRESVSVPGSTLPVNNDRFSKLDLASMTDASKLPKELREAMSVLPEKGFTKGDKPLQYSNDLKTSMRLEEARIVSPKSLSTELVGGKTTPRLASAGGPSKAGSVEQLRSPKDSRTVPLDANKLGEARQERRVKNYEAPRDAVAPDRKSAPREGRAGRQSQPEQDIFRGAPSHKSFDRPDSSAPSSKSREREYQRSESPPPAREIRPEPKSSPRPKESAPPPSRSSNFDRGYSPQPDRGYSPRSERGYSPAPERSYSPKFERGYSPGPERSYSPKFDRGPGHSMSSPRYSGPPSSGGGGLSSQPYRKGKG